MIKTKELKRVRDLCDDITSRIHPKMKWMWGEALFGYALSLLDAERYDDFLTSYCDYYMEHEPRIDAADTAAPGLITYACQKKHPDKGYEKLTNRVLHYIENEPRLLGDAVNHLGNSFVGNFYPKSIWVDSLMMFSVFPSLYGKEQKQPHLIDLAAKQPELYQQLMMDPDDHLWYHSYWTKTKKHYPIRKLYWGRGNGWVIASLPMILENISSSHPDYQTIVSILQQTATAILPFQNDDGSFNTLLNKRSYRELSVTALVAAGFLHGIRLGVLAEETYLAPALRAFHCCIDSLHVKDGKHIFPEVSGPTIPLPVLPYLSYRFTPKGDNWSYGLAALIFAALEFDKL